MTKNVLSMENVVQDPQQPGKTLLDHMRKLYDAGLKKNAGRLAMRVEGDDWVAYFAAEHTMDGAVRLGSVKMATVQTARHRKMFMDLMQSFISETLSAKFGKASWRGETQAIK